MPIDSSWNAYIFRDGKATFRGQQLVDDLVGGLLAWKGSASERVDLLLSAGELECALQDASSTHATLAETITDRLAASLVMGTQLHADEAAQLARTIVPPEQVEVAPPEGFAYYSLHPLDFADLARRCAPGSGYAAVVGIRSIGTTLGAVVTATLRGLGMHAERTSVRPEGHPYNRETRFSDDHLKWITGMRSRDSAFLVVDEGPGMSGSSFLSVGDALIAAGVPRSQISFLCTRQADPVSLTAADAAQRWPRFHIICAEPTRHLPKDAKQYVAGGIWRAKAFPSEENWPASWITMERLKFLSADGKRLFRFEGFGRFGKEVNCRAVRVADSGFGPMPDFREEGFGAYTMLGGRYLSATDAHTEVLNSIAEYCAFRAQELRSTVTRTPELETMLRFNIQEEFGVELPATLRNLPIELPVIADGRMLPHKWMTFEGRLLKLDAATHGDDHFFPGPTDIAWDLAGTIVEWGLEPEPASYFLDHYRARSGDDPTERLPAYLLAYVIFRTAYCKMASAAMSGLPEYDRMIRAYRTYRELCERRLWALKVLPRKNVQVA